MKEVKKNISDDVMDELMKIFELNNDNESLDTDVNEDTKKIARSYSLP